MCDDIDLEDLECRLYSQVFHANVDEELILETDVTFHSNGKANNNRYFSKGSLPSHPIFIPLENENDNSSERIYSPLHNNISLQSTSTNIIAEEHFSNHFQDNITFDQYAQYTGQFILNPNCGNENLIYPQQKKKKKQLIRRSQRLLRKNQERRNKTIIEIRPRVDHFIFISDESDSECVVVNDKQKKTLNTKGKPNTVEYIESDSENEIIYIPPPPVEIIDVDADTDEKTCDNIQEVSDLTVLSNQTKDPQKCADELPNTPESCANDFLDNSGIENNSSKFNFGLHGSDFNNTSDFLRPANPVEYCETESSCSTNDLNRENNSVKTIVFNEVEFPREDIFSEKNLESFSSYITPKRKSNNNPSKCSTKTSSENESSAESDYESSDIVNKNIKRLDLDSNKKLPTLSPMQDGKPTTTSAKSEIKLQKSKIQAASHTKKHGGKRKSNTFENTESDCDSNGNSKLIKKSSRKKKKTNCQESDENTQTQNKDNNDSCNEESINSSVSDLLIPEEDVNKGDSNEAVNKNATNISTIKKKKKNCKKYEIDNTETSNSNDSNTEKAKRKKPKSFSSESGLTSNTINDELNGCSLEIADINNTSASNVQGTSLVDKSIPTSVDEEQPDSVCNSSEPIINKMKRKKKKSISERLDDVNSNEVNEPTSGNEISNINSASNDKRVTKSKGEVDSETENNETVTLSKEQLENDQNVNKIASKDVPQMYKENQSEVSPSPINALEKIRSQDIIVIDEIVSSSESEADFVNLRDVGQDLKLANCGVKVNLVTTEEISNIDDFNSFYVINENVCEFDVQQIQSTQTDDPEAWKISPLDQLMCWNYDRKKGPRCSRCRQFGHIAVRCTEKLFLKCALCGIPGHQEPRCPNKRCYHCGNKGDYSTMYCWKCVKFRNSICRICNMKGHIAKTCPDLWRRYHLTTQEGPIVVSEKPQLKPRDELWCSGCARQGHLEHECDDQIRQYPPINPSIISYEDVLHKKDGNKNPNDIPAEQSVPIISAPQQSNFITSSSSIFSATSQNIPCSTPIFIPLVSQIPNENSIISIPAILSHNQALVPNDNINHNPSVSQPPTRVLNPFTVLVNLNQMMLDYVNDNKTKYLGIYQTQNHPLMIRQDAKEVIKKDQMKIRKIIMFMHPDVVYQFLVKEMADLENVVSKSDPKYLRQKLFKYDNIVRSRKVLNSDIVRESCFWYRILNMFIFGVHLYKDGEHHVNYIKTYLSESKEIEVDFTIRKRLLNAYNYIFDPTPHVNISYHKIMLRLIQTYNDDNE